MGHVAVVLHAYLLPWHGVVHTTLNSDVQICT